MLEAHRLRSGYGGAPVLHGMSLTVGAGEVVAVVGRNGMGKTTLVKTLMGVIGAMSGSVVLDGVDVTHSPPSRRVKLGLRATYQERGVFSAVSVGDNLRLNGFGPGRYREVLAAFPDSLAGRESQLAGTLSGGEQKMLAAAMALAADARFLVMDEPTEGLQPANVELLGSHITRARSAGRGVLLVEQHLALAVRLADRFVVIEKGEIVDSGVAADPGIHERLSERLAL